MFIFVNLYIFSGNIPKAILFASYGPDDLYWTHARLAFKGYRVRVLKTTGRGYHWQTGSSNRLYDSGISNIPLFRATKKAHRYLIE